VKSMHVCKLLDKYRDGELNSAERNGFDSHLAACEDCRMTISLLNNVVRLIKAEEVQPLDMADRIAREAFQRAHSWDFEIISWLRPGPALAALTLMIALFSSLWMITGNRQASAYSEYEKLMEEADAIDRGINLSQVRSDSEFVTWLEQEGNSQ
jgi:anti-sigma factor RsiW